MYMLRIGLHTLLEYSVIVYPTCQSLIHLSHMLSWLSVDNLD